MDWSKVAPLLQSLLTPVIAIATIALGVVTIRIQRQQARTNALHLRLALFERRMKVFDATMNMIAAVLRDAKVDLNQLFDLIRETRDHEMLFGPEVGKYIEEVYSRGLELRTRIVVGTQEDIQRSTDLLKWFNGQSAVARQIFLKYMDFREP